MNRNHSSNRSASCGIIFGGRKNILKRLLWARDEAIKNGGERMGVFVFFIKKIFSEDEKLSFFDITVLVLLKSCF